MPNQFNPNLKPTDSVLRNFAQMYKKIAGNTNRESQKEVMELINQSKVVCANCWLKLDNDLIEFDTF